MFVLEVYKELFEQSGVALAVGLGLGLSISFISTIIFCVFFYRLKAKYQN